VQALVNPEHPAAAATSTLSKLLAWVLDDTIKAAQRSGAVVRLLHHADWVASLLTGDRSTTDWNNCLKLGYNVERLEYPPALLQQTWASVLPPRVLAPGNLLGPVLPEISAKTGLPELCEVVAGTTDSIAAFLASGATEVGDAVTSLGSTLAVKLLSERPVQDARAGLYSHRLGMPNRLSTAPSAAKEDNKQAPI
jgi:sugar (pentulose or hexulose) kinase